MKNFTVGMQVHAHDIKDEGADAVLDNMRRLAGVTAIYPTANHNEERQPYPKGEFPHNPVRKEFYTKGGLYFEPHLEHYRNSPLKPQRTPELGLGDFDVLRAITGPAKQNGVRVLPWIVALNDPVISGKYGKYSMIDVYGNRVDGWLCPSHAEVRTYVLSLIKDLIKSYDIDGIFLDRIRFPEWTRGSTQHGEGFDSAFSCFCKECAKRAKTSGINLSKTRTCVRRIADCVRENRLAPVISRFLAYRKGCLDLAKILVDMPELNEWINFRQDIIGDFVTEVHKLIKGTSSKLELSLDLWPPSYSWLLGQNYVKLRKSCDSLKYFTYHKIGGGVDLKAVVQELKRLNPDLEVAKFMDLFYRFFGFSGPTDLEKFGEEGFTVDFVLEETLKALDECKREVEVYPGLQIWDVTPEEVKEAVHKASEANVDGVIAFCYGWATLENIQCFGDAVKESEA
jgi:hypothetical protein